MKPSTPCPCGSNQPYTACCNRWHAGEPAPTAEALMRSRYAAFAVNNEEYLLRTWHVSARPKTVELDSQQKWLWLKVLDAKDIGNDEAEVEFIACYRLGGGSATRMRERSRFVKEGQHWFYVGPVDARH